MATSAADAPPEPWAIDMTKMALKPTAEPSDSHAPDPPPAANWEPAADRRESAANTSHDTRWGRALPRLMATR